MGVEGVVSMNEKVEVPLDEVKRLFLFLEDLNSFFHDPDKYNNQERLVKYVESGMYEKLHSMYYQVVWSWLPPTVQKEIEGR